MKGQSNIHRRRFEQQSSLLMASAMVPFSSFSMTSSHKYKMGLQLFTIRDAMAEDALGSLKKVRALV